MNIENILKIGRKIIPKPIFLFFRPFYHYKLAALAAIWYWFPSRNITVIGVTGTNGKSTVVEMLHNIFEEAGFAVASISSVRFRIKNQEWKNDLKMTMPGRFSLQKFIRDSKRNGCKFVILEITSEGIRQFRHKNISFNVAVLTNVTPEHIESHGSFEEYRQAKLKLFKISPWHVLNGDDKNLDYFADVPAEKRSIYYLKDFPGNLHLKILGDFNKSNALAAIECARLFDVEDKIIFAALEMIEEIPGRLEFISEEPFSVVVDYAHTPDALIKVYQTLKNQGGRMICVLGACGGGRDKWKRPEFGKIAEKFCDEIILTNEDPYDENPQSILEDIESGFSEIKKSIKIIDRKEAIKKAISDAKQGDTVIITGKGCESWIMIEDGKKIPWDDREIARQALKELPS
ncbi:Mur ligase family protein [Patescibacteria group bacterium]